MSLIIGLTGPTGAGKSLAAGLAKELGFNVIDCDLLSRQAVEKGTDGLNALTDAFGKGILNADGTLNRKTLAAIAFSSKEKTELLNKTLLPHIKRLLEDNILENKPNILDAPTLFESGADSLCSKTICVIAPKSVRLERIKKRDNLSDSEALLRISAQKNDEFYKDKTDIEIVNNGDMDKFKKQVTKIFTEIVGG